MKKEEEKVIEKTRKVLSTVETRPAILHVIGGDTPFIQDENGDAKEFKNRKEAKAYFAKTFKSFPDTVGITYVMDEMLRFVHKTPTVKAEKA